MEFNYLNPLRFLWFSPTVFLVVLDSSVSSVPNVGAMQLPTVGFSGTAPCQWRTADLAKQRCFLPMFFWGKNLSVFFGTVENGVFFSTCHLKDMSADEIWIIFSRTKCFKKSLRKHHLYSFWACRFFTDAVSNAPLRVLSDLCFHPPNVLSLQENKIHHKGWDYVTTIKSGYRTKNTHEMY